MPLSVSTFRKVILLSQRAVRCAASISLARLASTSAFDPFGRASRMPLSSKVSRIAAMRKLSSPVSIPSPPEYSDGSAMISLSPLSTLPPGNTSAPELKSIS